MLILSLPSCWRALNGAHAPATMRLRTFFAGTGIVLICLGMTPIHAVPVAQLHSKDTVNYVVIGAFSIKNNAVKLIRHATALKYTAKFDFNQGRSLYYVYVLQTSDRDAAIREALRLRGESEFTDAWVFNGDFGINAPGPVKDIDPVTEAKIETVKMEDPVVSVAGPTTPVTENPKPKEEEKPFEVPAGSGKPFMFQLFRGSDRVILTGEVEVVDIEKSRKVGTYKGNEPVRIPLWKSKPGQVSLIPQVFGYRKMQRDVDYNNPTAEDITLEQDVTVIPFELVKLQKGDISVMYNVYFYRDAAIMRPESQYEVGELYTMMAENPKLKIRLHGHANGNASGRIITIGTEKNFFSLDGSKDSFGSSKALSEERALVVKEYLVTKGIDANRVEVKAWGGKRPIFDKNSARAQENVRVEVEILEDK